MVKGTFYRSLHSIPYNVSPRRTRDSINCFGAKNAIQVLTSIARYIAVATPWFFYNCTAKVLWDIWFLSEHKPELERIRVVCKELTFVSNLLVTLAHPTLIHNLVPRNALHHLWGHITMFRFQKRIEYKYTFERFGIGLTEANLHRFVIIGPQKWKTGLVKHIREWLAISEPLEQLFRCFGQITVSYLTAATKTRRTGFWQWLAGPGTSYPIFVDVYLFT